MKTSDFLKNYRRVKNVWIPRQHRATGDGKHRGPNATEARYRHEILWSYVASDRYEVTYEPQPFLITSVTHREYTPDFAVVDKTGATRNVYHEVKGGYKLGSEDRARLAWEIAAETHPEHDFVWAVATSRGWEIERWSFGGLKILVHLPGMNPWEYIEAEHDWRKHRPKKRKAKR